MDQGDAISKHAVPRQMQRALDNLKFRQTSSSGIQPAGFAYAEVPDWQLKQWIAALENADRAFECPIQSKNCTKNCGSYGCGN